jgi:rod shape-determining protein MreD
MMQNFNRRRVYFTLLAALLLQLLPFSGIWLQIKPDFLLLALLFWLLRAPSICNIGIAWTAGVLMDLISGDLFGQNALAYSLTAFLAVMYQRRLILFTVLQQSVYVFLLLFVNQLILLLLKSFSGSEYFGWTYFVPSFTGIMFWYALLHSRLSVNIMARQQ